MTMEDTTKVAIGYVHPDQISAHFHKSLVGVMLWDRHTSKRVDQVIDMFSGPRIASARNMIVEAFLDQTSAEWLWMLDTDMVFPPTMLDSLCSIVDADESPIVSALCFAGGRSGTVVPTIRVAVSDGSDGAVEMAVVSEYPPDSLCSVDATGAACVMIHRRVFEAIREHYQDRGFIWFAESETMGRDYGEDVVFCLRARALGFPVKVHTGLVCGHVKPDILDEETYRAYQAALAEHGEEELKQRHLTKMGIVGAEYVRT